jgi:hypothetical protein
MVLVSAAVLQHWSRIYIIVNIRTDDNNTSTTTTATTAKVRKLTKIWNP